MGFLRKLMARMREPSTLAGLAGLAVLGGIPMDTINIYAQAAAAVLSLAAVVVPEEKPPLLIVKAGK